MTMAPPQAVPNAQAEGAREVPGGTQSPDGFDYRTNPDHPGYPDRPDYQAFLQQHLATQPRNIGRHRWGGEDIWVKRAGEPHPMGRYRAMDALARLLRLQVLRPVPNPGGPIAIATEVRRLHELAALGIRVPVVLAAAPNGFAMRSLGHAGEVPHSLGNAIRDAAHSGDTPRVLALWQQGLQAMTQVHQQGACLSQAFARNMVCCPDGGVACVAFEDVPAAVLPLAVCHVRDALCYAHSTAIYLHASDALPEARERWGKWVAQGSDGMKSALADTARRMRWVRRLPDSRKLGRDLQRLRMAYELIQG